MVASPSRSFIPARPRNFWLHTIFAVTLLAAAAPHALAQQYAVTDLGTLGQDASNGVAINANGEAAGLATTHGISEETPDTVQAFLYAGGAATPIPLKISPQVQGGTSTYDPYILTVNPNVINASGQVVGTTSNGHAGIYSNGTVKDLGALSGGVSQGLAINDRGEATGNSSTVPYTGQSYSPHPHAFLYDNGSMADLGTLGGNGSVGVAINALGQVAGTSDTGTRSAVSGLLNWHAFLDSSGKMVDLGTLGGDDSQANALNARGQVTGVADVSNTTNALGQEVVVFHAFLYSNGKMIDLGTLGGSASEGDAVNAKGQVIGYSKTSQDLSDDGFFYSNGKIVDLGTFRPSAINDIGQIVGDSSGEAALWNNGKVVNLNSEIGSDASIYTLSSAVAINDAGQILADGTNYTTGHSVALLLTPVPIPGASWLMLSSLCGLALLIVPRRKTPGIRVIGECPAAAPWRALATA